MQPKTKSRLAPLILLASAREVTVGRGRLPFVEHGRAPLHEDQALRIRCIAVEARQKRVVWRRLERSDRLLVERPGGLFMVELVQC